MVVYTCAAYRLHMCTRVYTCKPLACMCTHPAAVMCPEGAHTAAGMRTHAHRPVGLWVALWGPPTVLRARRPGPLALGFLKTTLGAAARPIARAHVRARARVLGGEIGPILATQNLSVGGVPPKLFESQNG